MNVKNIFKKNQVIITALAIMIVIAGYISFTDKDKPGGDSTATLNPGTGQVDILTEIDGLDLVENDTDISDNDMDDENADNDTDEMMETTGTDDNDETTPVETLSDDELGDLSDDDLLANANNVADNGEIDLENGIPGEAVMASTTIDPNFFISNRIEREQMRARNKAAYLEIIESPDVAEALKTETINRMIALTDIAEKENNTEIALEARGFDDALVSINDGKVDVIINAATISDQQLAIIEEIVKNKTDIPVTKMTIVPTIFEE